MTGPVNLRLILGEIAFWLALEAGLYTKVLRRRVVVLFVALWVGGHAGLPLLLPAEDLLAPYVFVLVLGLILTILTREIAVSDEPSE